MRGALVVPVDFRLNCRPRVPVYRLPVAQPIAFITDDRTGYIEAEGELALGLACG
jgi:hypothetical protein